MELKDALWKENYDKYKQHIKKQRYHFADKGPYSQSYVFSGSHGCESWTIKKAEHWSTDTFKLWCWRSLLRVPWSARRSNKSILKEISPELEGLPLKLQYCVPPDVKSRLIGKDPDAGKD